MLALLIFLASGPAVAPSSSTLAAISREQESLFKRIAPSVVFIRSGEGVGSGFFITRDGLVLTNAHVVGDRPRVDIVLYSGQRLVGEVVERGAGKVDVALVKVAVKDAPVPDLGGLVDIEVGSWVGAVGHGEGTLWTFNSGMVSNVYPDGADRPLFQTQIPVNPGNSGGPIFTVTGRVVGVVTAGIRDASLVNFGIGLDVARRALPKMADASDMLVVTAPEGVPIFVDGVMAGTGPRVVVAVKPDIEHELSAVINGEMVRKNARFPAVKRVELKK